MNIIDNFNNACSELLNVDVIMEYSEDSEYLKISLKAKHKAAFEGFGLGSKKTYITHPKNKDLDFSKIFKEIGYT